MAVKFVAPEVPPAEKIQTTYKQLSQAAVELNTASDELNKPIYVWDGALKKLNLGVAAWVELSGSDDGSGYWWDRGVGYARLKGRWGIALRTREGHHGADEGTEELWHFNDAPRWLRIEAVGKLPDLLEALLKQADDTTKKIRKKITQANELAEAIVKGVDGSQQVEAK